MTFNQFSDGDIATCVIDLEVQAIEAEDYHSMETLLDQSVVYRRELVERVGERHTALLLEELRISRGISI